MRAWIHPMRAWDLRRTRKQMATDPDVQRMRFLLTIAAEATNSSQPRKVLHTDLPTEHPDKLAHAAQSCIDRHLIDATFVHGGVRIDRITPEGEQFLRLCTPRPRWKQARS